MRAMARTAVAEPSKVPPWLVSRLRTLSNGIPAEFATWRETRHLPQQATRTADLRDRDRCVLVILDACRYDYFEDVFGPLLAGEMTPVKSVAHDTFEYLQRVWPGDHDVHYVTGAVPINSEYMAEREQFHLYDGYQPKHHLSTIDDVWKDAWDPTLGCCPPEPVTDAALAARDEPNLVVHYQQPHTPYVGTERELGHTNNESAHPERGEPVDKPIWDRVHSGEISDERLHELYRSNVERVAGEVCRLVDELEDRQVVITADHGEALGEYGVYAHPRWPSHPHVRTVPWVEAELTETGETVAAEAGFEGPSVGVQAGETGVQNDELSTKDRLAALGYR